MVGLNVLGPAASAVEQVLTPLVYTSPTFGGAWALLDHAIFTACIRYAGSEGSDRLEFETPYGTVLSALTGSFSVRSALNLVGQWVRLDMIDADGSLQTVFLGQVRGEERTVFGSESDVAGSSAPKPKGFQLWKVYGGQLLLKLLSISTSFWADPEVASRVVEIGWTPGFNRRDSHGLLAGNRGDAHAPDDSGSFVFGGKATWTRRQALDYLLKRFLNRTDENGDPVGPVWTIGGQVSVLDEDLRILDLGVATTAEQVITKIVAHREGIDWGVYPVFDGETPVGFEIRIFTLVGQDVTFRGCTLPGNPNRVSFEASGARDVAALVVATDHTKRASRVRLVGSRVVVCATLRGPALSGEPLGDVLTSTVASLIGKWTAAQESVYKAGATGVSATDQEELHDTARTAEILKPVYLRYGLPVGWPRSSAWRPKFDGSGNKIPDAAPYQDSVRETLSWLPLRQGFDYTADPPTNQNPSDEAEPDFRVPFLIAENRKAEIEASTSQPPTPHAGATLWAAGEVLGLGHSVLKKDLGVQVHAAPNHRLARGRAAFDGTDASVSRLDPADDLNEHAIDARTLAVTLAWRSDARFVLEAALDADADDGSVIEIAVPEAELWWLAPGTIVDVRDGEPVLAPSAGLVARNDADVYAPMMAGVIARYMFARTRADLTLHGWRPWLELLGSILTTVEEGGEMHGVNAPITAVEIYGGRDGQPRTVVRAGFAP